ncbi:MAG: type II secretion system minor pseudopilin GspJ [Legionella sp.]|nr:type II secretion system minor pseudopilin GspJ [Legionella sp.]
MRNSHGYTLIEVVIALAIFAILGTLSVGVLSRAFDTKARLATQIEPLNHIQLAIARITQNAAQIVARPVLNQDIKKTPAFVGNTHSIEFTRGGFISTPTLKRMALSCEDGNLIQSTWLTLDKFDETPPQQQILLSQLTQCYFTLLSQDKTWSDTWGENNTLPAAFKLHLNIKSLGEITPVFIIAGGMHAN